MAVNFREPNQVRWIGFRPGHNGTQVTKQGAANNTTTIVHTVTAGKVLYLVDWTVGWESLALGSWCALRVRNAADVLAFDIWTMPTRAVLNGGLAVAYIYPIEIPAGYDVVVAAANGNVSIYGFIHGWEDTAPV